MDNKGYLITSSNCVDTAGNITCFLCYTLRTINIPGESYVEPWSTTYSRFVVRRTAFDHFHHPHRPGRNNTLDSMIPMARRTCHLRMIGILQRQRRHHSSGNNWEAICCEKALIFIAKSSHLLINEELPNDEALPLSSMVNTKGPCATDIECMDCSQKP